MATVNVYTELGPPYVLRVTVSDPAETAPADAIDYSTVTAVSMRARHRDGSVSQWPAEIASQSATQLVAVHGFETTDLWCRERMTVLVEMAVPAGTLVAEPVVLNVIRR